MSDKTQASIDQAVSTLIDKAIAGVDSTVGFLQAEIPEYVYQLVLWYGIKSLIVGVLWLAISALWFYFGVVKPLKLIGKGKRDEEANFFVDNCGDIEFHGVMLLISNIFLFLPVLISVKNLLEALQIWIAPKVWLVEYAADLAK